MDKNSLEETGVALIVNKRVLHAAFGPYLKSNTMILVHFQGKPFNSTVTQVYAPTTNAKETEVEWSYKDL